MSFYKSLIYNSNQPVMFMSKPKYTMVKESSDVLIPRFKLKNTDIFDDFPTDEHVKFSLPLILKAIEWGMIIQIEYKGDEDNLQEGHTRTIYPMTVGYSSQNKVLLRGWHFNGWSVSQGTNVDKTWRLFRGDRILSMKFTGSFFRLAPDGYVMRDKSMKKILGMADFNKIRANQQTLLNDDKIDTHDRSIVKRLNRVNVKNMNFILNLSDPWRSNVLKKSDSKDIRVSFATPVVGSGVPIAIIGTMIESGRIFKMYDDNNDLIGSFKSIKYVENGEELEKLKRLNGNIIEFKLYLFTSLK